MCFTGPGEVDQDAFTQPVFAHHAPRGVQLFHHAAKDEHARGNDAFAARFQAGHLDAGRLRFAEHLALDTPDHRQFQYVILNPRGIIGGEFWATAANEVIVPAVPTRVRSMTSPISRRALRVRSRIKISAC